MVTGPSGDHLMSSLLQEYDCSMSHLGLFINIIRKFRTLEVGEVRRLKNPSYAPKLPML